MEENKINSEMMPFRLWFDETVAVLKQTSDALITKGEKINPMMFVFGYKPGEVKVIEIDMGLDAAVHAQKLLSSADQLVSGVIIMTEAWSAEMTAPPPPGVSLKDIPGRRECLMFHGRRGNDELLAFSEIKRPDGDTMVGSTLGETRVIDLQETPNMADTIGRTLH